LTEESPFTEEIPEDGIFDTIVQSPPNPTFAFILDYIKIIVTYLGIRFDEFPGKEAHSCPAIRTGEETDRSSGWPTSKISGCTLSQHSISSFSVSAF
jgi:hypothetical protein